MARAAKPAAKTKKPDSTRIDIASNSRAKIAAMLNQLLADTTDMHLRTKHAHWNVKGPNFIALHKYFDELYSVIGAHVDEVAERIAAVGGFVEGRLSDAAGSSRLKQFPTDAQDGMAVVRALADSLGQVCNATRDGIESAEELEDAVTADVLTGMAGELDKHLWFLEAHLR